MQPVLNAPDVMPPARAMGPGVPGHACSQPAEWTEPTLQRPIVVRHARRDVLRYEQARRDAAKFAATGSHGRLGCRADGYSLRGG